jgi:predicted secreted Zn-dependent protease
MAGKVTLKKDSSKIDTYKVKGDTLADIWKDIQKKGPKDGGKSRAGFTKAPVKTPNKLGFDMKIEPDPDKPDEFVATVWIKSAKITLKPTIKMPKLASDKKLSAPAKKEWARFISELKSHEEEHVTATETEAKAVAQEMQDIEGKGTGKDKKKALKAAQKDFVKVFKAALGGTQLDDRLKAVNKRLDSGGHGPVLDTSIP